MEKFSKRYCSTPIRNKVRTIGNITLSTIGTTSSSSTKAKSEENVPVAKRYRKRKKKLITSKKKRKHTKEDSDWETRSEESVFGDLTPEISSPKVVHSDRQFGGLFENTRSPEKIREARYRAKDTVGSPLFRDRRSFFLGSEKEVPQPQTEVVSLVDVPSLNLRSLYEDDNEDFQIRRESIFKVYKAPVQEKQSIAERSKDKKWLVDLKVPTASSDLLWEKFVESNRTEVSQYLAPVFKNPRKESLSVTKKRPTYHPIVLERENVQKTDVNRGKGNETKTKKGKRKELISTPSAEMSVIRGYWDAPSRKFVHVTDEYTYIDTENKEFERGGQNGKRLTLDEFRRMRQLEKAITEDQETLGEVSSHRKRSKVAFTGKKGNARNSRNSYGIENHSIFKVSSEDYGEGQSTHRMESNMTPPSRKVWRRRGDRHDMIDIVDDSWNKSCGSTQHAKLEGNRQTRRINRNSSTNDSEGYIPDESHVATTRTRFRKSSMAKNRDGPIGADTVTCEIQQREKKFPRRLRDDPSVISFAGEEYSNVKQKNFDQFPILRSKRQMVGYKSSENTDENDMGGSQTNTSGYIDKITSRRRQDYTNMGNISARNEEPCSVRRSKPKIISSVLLTEKLGIKRLWKKNNKK